MPTEPFFQRKTLVKSRRSLVNYTKEVCLEITNGVVSEFFRWLKHDNPRIRESTVKQYRYYIPRLVGISLCGKKDVEKAFKAMGGLNKSSYEAFSRFLTFLEKTRDLDELVAKLRKAMPPKPKTKEDTYIPPDSLVLQVRNKVKELGPPYTLIYNILISSGSRGTEARYLVANIRKLKTVNLHEYVRVHVDLQRGSKNEFIMYLPREVYEQILGWKGKLPHQDTIEDKFRELGLAIKYFRKWWRQKLKLLGIDSETIEAFQGRTKTIGAKHYTDWIPILDEEYRKILPTIKEFIILT